MTKVPRLSGCGALRVVDAPGMVVGPGVRWARMAVKPPSCISTTLQSPHARTRRLQPTRD